MNPEFNPERNSSIDQFIARDPEEKEAAEKRYADRFSNQEIKDLEGKEIKKSEEQIRIIEMVNEETNNLMEKYGVKKFDIPADNFHIVNHKDFIALTGDEDKNSKLLAVLNEKKQAVLLDQSNLFPRTAFAKRVFHEMVHFKSRQIVAVNSEKSSSSNQHGLALDAGEVKVNEESKESTKDIPNAEDFFESLKKEKGVKNKSYFENLNEAVTEELAIRSKNNLLKNPDFKKEADLIKEYVAYKKSKGIEIDENEIISARKIITYSPDNKKEYIKFKKREASYKPQRKILNRLINKLYEGNRDNFNDREEVFDLFAKSSFTGDIVGKNGWGRLVEKTFGNGALKQLGEKDSDLKELDRFINGLEIKHSS